MAPAHSPKRYSNLYAAGDIYSCGRKKSIAASSDVLGQPAREHVRGCHRLPDTSLVSADYMLPCENNSS